MLKAYKYRIYPNKTQSVRIDQTIDSCRFIYNLGLETKINAYKSYGKNLTYFDLSRQLTDLKKDCTWLKEVDSQALLASIKTLIVAYQNFFKRGGFPKFKSKRLNGSFCCRSLLHWIDLENRFLTIPKVKNIPIVLSRKFEGKIKTVTISKTTTGKYYASILIEDQIQVPEKRPIVPETTLGIDLGIKDFAITSEGVKYENPKYLRNALDRLKVLQYRASKKKKGSANRRKANKRVATLHERIKNQRTDFLQKLSSKLVYDSQASSICIEDLSIYGMIKNKKLSLSISDACWAEFVKMLSYKCEWAGKNLIKIGRFEPSSKTCSNCGFINKELQIFNRDWGCSKCGSIHDRDLNAAINIKNSGLRKSGEPAECSGLYDAMTQENN